MEFYFRRFTRTRRIISFNSQRDGILRKTALRRKTATNVSIPNGMEFYSRGLWGMDQNEEVSIPNGMEFYSTASSPACASTIGFNSQRDGILLNKLKSKIPWYGKFQFPTGWNSTQTMLVVDESSFSFNSQRDGILLGDRTPCDSPRRVSIPNGMEFYAGIILKDPYLWEFQFPTGWNSTCR